MAVESVEPAGVDIFSRSLSRLSKSSSELLDIEKCNNLKIKELHDWVPPDKHQQKNVSKFDSTQTQQFIFLLCGQRFFQGLNEWLIFSTQNRHFITMTFSLIKSHFSILFSFKEVMDPYQRTFWVMWPFLAVSLILNLDIW
jgi:hypothetical protein